MTLTRGTGLMSHIFDGFAPVRGEIPDRHNGVLISNEVGEAVAYALFNLQERGRMFVSPGEKLYESMIIGIHSRENDLVGSRMAHSVVRVTFWGALAMTLIAGIGSLFRISA